MDENLILVAFADESHAYEGLAKLQQLDGSANWRSATPASSSAMPTACSPSARAETTCRRRGRRPER